MTGSSMPSEWHKTTLGAVAQWGSGGTPSRKNPEYYGGDVPWVKTGDLGPKVLSAASEYITELGVQKSSAKYFPKGSVAIAMYGATIGKTSILGFNATTNQACAVGQPIDGITDTTFLYYLLRNEKDAFIAKGKGGAQPNISQALIKEHGIALPPLAEQKVIADKLGTLLAQVETTKARLERIPKILKRFRQSVLAAAVSGRLTEEWRDGTCLPEWEVTVLGNVIGNIDQGWSPKCHNEPTADESWGVIKTSSVLPMAFAEYENKKLPDSLDVRPNLRVLTNDILTTRAGPRSRCGVTCYVSTTSKNLMICDKVYRYRVIDGKGSSKFLALQLNSPSVLEKIETLKTGISESGMNLTQKKFRQLELNWPAPEEQTEIVRQVDQLFAYADRIEQQVNNALARVNNLTQSILAKAFRGELTEQWRKDNPELISGVNSAEALLARIRAERAAAQPAKRTRKRKASA